VDEYHVKTKASEVSQIACQFLFLNLELLQNNRQRASSESH